MDREDPDIVGLQTSFIRSMVKPCFEALSQSNIILGGWWLYRIRVSKNYYSYIMMKYIPYHDEVYTIRIPFQ